MVTGSGLGLAMPAIRNTPKISTRRHLRNRSRVEIPARFSMTKSSGTANASPKASIVAVTKLTGTGRPGSGSARRRGVQGEQVVHGPMPSRQVARRDAGAEQRDCAAPSEQVAAGSAGSARRRAGAHSGCSAPCDGASGKVARPHHGAGGRGDPPPGGPAVRGTRLLVSFGSGEVPAAGSAFRRRGEVGEVAAELRGLVRPPAPMLDEVTWWRCEPTEVSAVWAIAPQARGRPAIERLTGHDSGSCFWRAHRTRDSPRPVPGSAVQAAPGAGVSGTGQPLLRSRGGSA